MRGRETERGGERQRERGGGRQTERGTERDGGRGGGRREREIDRERVRGSDIET